VGHLAGDDGFFVRNFVRDLECPRKLAASGVMGDGMGHHRRLGTRFVASGIFTSHQRGMDRDFLGWRLRFDLREFSSDAGGPNTKAPIAMKRINYPQPVITLIHELKRLPGIGPRSAERMAVWLLQSSRADVPALATSLLEAQQVIRPCPVCGFFATAGGCEVCDDATREPHLLCVVEQATDVLPLERSGAFRGRYHCLGGKLSPLDRVSPEDLQIPSLLRRIDETGEEIEVILALGSDVEGEATANYLAELLRGRNCRLTRIAQGLPAGGGLEHADDLTLMRAMQGRRSLE
jgi:recombination protein RecR